MPIVPFIPAMIAAGSSIAGKVIQSKAAGKAADIQSENAAKVAQMAQDAAAKAGTGVTEAAGQANLTLADIFNQQSGTLSPYLQAGNQGVTTLMEMLAPGGMLSEQFKAPTAEEAAATPGFQFQMDEARKALERGAAARGTLSSGGTLKALTKYGQDIASTYYQNAFNNALTGFQTNRNNALAGQGTLANLGQFGVGQFNQAAGNYGSQAAGNLMNAAQYAGDADLTAAQLAGNALTGGANAQAGAAWAKGNAANNMIGGLAGAATDVVNILGKLPKAAPNNNFLNWASTQPILPPPPNIQTQAPALSLPALLQPPKVPGYGAGGYSFGW